MSRKALLAPALTAASHTSLCSRGFPKNSQLIKPNTSHLRTLKAGASHQTLSVKAFSAVPGHKKPPFSRFRLKRIKGFEPDPDPSLAPAGLDRPRDSRVDLKRLEAASQTQIQTLHQTGPGGSRLPRLHVGKKHEASNQPSPTLHPTGLDRSTRSGRPGKPLHLKKMRGLEPDPNPNFAPVILDRSNWFKAEGLQARLILKKHKRPRVRPSSNPARAWSRQVRKKKRQECDQSLREPLNP